MKQKAIELAFQIATLRHPGPEVIELLMPLPYDRTLELLLILRQSPKPVRSPLNFLKRAIEEEWTPETTPQKVNRFVQNHAENHYIRQGYSPEEAREKVRQFKSDRWG